VTKYLPNQIHGLGIQDGLTRWFDKQTISAPQMTETVLLEDKLF